MGNMATVRRIDVLRSAFPGAAPFAQELSDDDDLLIELKGQLGAIWRNDRDQGPDLFGEQVRQAVSLGATTRSA
jgi:hypothetical protein